MLFDGVGFYTDEAAGSQDTHSFVSDRVLYEALSDLLL